MLKAMLTNHNGNQVSLLHIAAGIGKHRVINTPGFRDAGAWRLRDQREYDCNGVFRE